MKKDIELLYLALGSFALSFVCVVAGQIISATQISGWLVCMSFVFGFAGIGIGIAFLHERYAEKSRY